MKKIITIIAGATLVLGLSSCAKLLDIDQHGVLEYDTYYDTDEQAQAAVASIYNSVRSLEYNVKFLKNLLSDEFYAGGGDRNDNTDLEAINEYTFTEENSVIRGAFQSYYSIIYKANVVLGHVADDPASNIKQQMRAEAKVFRAWSYFELISMWGNPPLVDHELKDDEYAQPNGTTEALWKFVEDDLKEAIASGKLSEKKSLNDKSTWRVTKQFAQALLGKAYLWQKKYTEAAAAFEQVISSKKYDLFQDDYEDVIAYSQNMNCESLFESVRVYDKENAFDNYSQYGVMINYRADKLKSGGMAKAGLAPNGWGFCVPQKRLYDAFVEVEGGTKGARLNATIKTAAQMEDMGLAVDAGKRMINDGYFFWKWRVTSDELPPEGYGMFVYLNNVRWMRYAEVLLCAAEANLLASSPDQAKADEYLSAVRERAGLNAKAGVTLEDIQKEKQVELCGECCRFQDMLRWNIAADLLREQGKDCPFLDSDGVVTRKVYNNDASRYGFKTPKHNLLPYPGVERRLNGNLVQNEGWN